MQLPHPTIGSLPMVGSPLKMSASSVEYKLPPPLLGEHTEKILFDVLGYTSDQITELEKDGAITRQSNI